MSLGIRRRLAFAGLVAAAAVLLSTRLASPFDVYHDNVAAVYAGWADNFLRPGGFTVAPDRRLAHDGTPAGPEHLYAHRPPLVSWSIAASVALFGRSEGAVRAVGVLAGIGAVAAFGAFALQVLGWRWGLLATALLAVLPPFVFYGAPVAHQTAGMLGAAAILAVYAAWRRRPGRRRLAALAITVLVACWTDWPAFYAAGGATAVELFRPRAGRKVAWVPAATAVLAFGVFVLYVYALDPSGRAPLRDLFATGGDYVRGSEGLGYLRRLGWKVVQGFTPAFLILAGAGLVLALRRPRRRALVLAAATLPLGADPVLFARLTESHLFMIAPMAPAVALWAALGLRRLGRGAAGWVLGGLLGAVGAGQAVRTLVQYHRDADFPYYAQVSLALGQAVAEATAPGERVLVQLYCDPSVLAYYGERGAGLHSARRRGLLHVDRARREEGVDENELLRRIETGRSGFAWFVTTTARRAAPHLPVLRALADEVGNPDDEARKRYGFESEAAPSALVRRLGAPTREARGFLFYRLDP